MEHPILQTLSLLIFQTRNTNNLSCQLFKHATESIVGWNKIEFFMLFFCADIKIRLSIWSVPAELLQHSLSQIVFCSKILLGLPCLFHKLFLSFDAFIQFIWFVFQPIFGDCCDYTCYRCIIRMFIHPNSISPIKFASWVLGKQPCQHLFSCW